jgi:hypothetical protein
MEGDAEEMPEPAVGQRADMAYPSGFAATAQRSMVLVGYGWNAGSRGWDGGSRSPAASSEVTGFGGWRTPASWCSHQPDRVYLDGCFLRFDVASVALERGERSLHEWSWI